METSSILLPGPVSQISFFFFSSPNSKPNRSQQPCEWKPQPNRRRRRLLCGKMFVPGFGEASPEAKAANNLHGFFTYIAVKIVLAQLESYNHEAYKELMDFLDKNSLNVDGDQFCANLMRESPRHKGLAMRILEVRSAYCKNDFEWDNLKKLSVKMVDKSNTRLMRDYVSETSHIEDKEK